MPAPSEAQALFLAIFFPGYVTALTNTLSGGSLASNTISWSLGTVNSHAGGSKSFQVRVNTNTPSSLSITNRAQVFGCEAEETGKTNNNYSTLITRIANRPPVAQNDSYTVNENTVLVISAPGVLANDSDPDGNSLTAVLVSGPAHGSLTLNFNGSFTYTPMNNFTGPDSFTYRASDGITNSGIATVSITVTPVNSTPVVVNDNYSTPEDTTLTITAPGVLSNDSDVDGDVLTAILVTSPAHGTLSLNTNGGFSYTPSNNYNGPDSFTYRASDGITNSAIATVSIIVTPVNDAPVAANDNYTIPEDTTLTITAPGVLSNDSDVDGDVLTAVLVTSPAHGILTLNTNGGFSYTPSNNYNGPDSFTYKTSDGTTNSGIATVSITVTPVNDAPGAVNDEYTTPEDTTLTIPAPGVLSNDSDVDGDMLTAILVTSPAHGTLALNTNGGFSYTPSNNYNGPDSFTYRASDGITNSGIATGSITVTPVNDSPVAVNDNYSTPEDTTLTITAPGVLSNDSDPDSDGLTAILVTGPAHGTLTLNTNGGFNYTPTNNYNGPDSFTYRASDGQTNSAIATATIRVTPVNDPPNTNNWSGGSFSVLEDTTLNMSAPGVLAGITDVDGDVISAVFVCNPTHGTLNLNTNGSFTYIPATNYNGPDSFQFTASDGQAFSPTLTVNITVIPVNDPPSFTKGANQLVQENAGAQTVPGWAANLSPGPADEAGQAVIFQVSNNTNALFSVPPAVSSSGTLTYTPAPNAYGVATITVAAHDDGGIANGGLDTSAPQTFVITVNSPPTVSLISPTNGAVYVAPANFTVLANAQDVDGTIAKVEFFNGTNSLGEVTAGEPYFLVRTNVPTGTYTFGATATDNLGATGAAIPVTVTVIDRPPLTILSALHYNPQTDFFEVRVRVNNPTYSTFDAARVCVLNLTNTPAITVHNGCGFTNAIPYVQTPAAVLPGTYVDMTVEFYSPLRIAPNPVLRPELVGVSGVLPAPSGTPQHINQGLLFANKTFMVEFATQSNRVYSVQYSSDLILWKPSLPAVTGNGGWVQWIDNGQPKTDSAPAAQTARFYRVILLP